MKAYPGGKACVPAKVIAYELESLFKRLPIFECTARHLLRKCSLEICHEISSQVLRQVWEDNHHQISIFVVNPQTSAMIWDDQNYTNR